jgi:hypothetical protein
MPVHPDADERTRAAGAGADVGLEQILRAAAESKAAEQRRLNPTPNVLRPFQRVESGDLHEREGARTDDRAQARRLLPSVAPIGNRIVTRVDAIVGHEDPLVSGIEPLVREENAAEGPRQPASDVRHCPAGPEALLHRYRERIA